MIFEIRPMFLSKYIHTVRHFVTVRVMKHRRWSTDSIRRHQSRCKHRAKPSHAPVLPALNIYCVYISLERSNIVTQYHRAQRKYFFLGQFRYNEWRCKPFIKFPPLYSKNVLKHLPSFTRNTKKDTMKKNS